MTLKDLLDLPWASVEPSFARMTKDELVDAQSVMQERTEELLSEPDRSTHQQAELERLDRLKKVANKIQVSRAASRPDESATTRQSKL